MRCRKIPAVRFRRDARLSFSLLQSRLRLLQRGFFLLQLLVRPALVEADHHVARLHRRVLRRKPNDSQVRHVRWRRDLN